jgi:hypothetical protein
MAIRPWLRSFAPALALTACTSTTSPVDVEGAALDVLADLACFREVVALVTKVHPTSAQTVRNKIETGQPLDPMERQLLLEGIDRLRAAGKCLAKS